MTDDAKIEAPPARAYSTKPGAVRQRRFREKRRRERELVTEKGPITSYACGCGYKIRLRGTFADTIRAFEAHGPCLFTSGVQIVQVNVHAGRPRKVAAPRRA